MNVPAQSPSALDAFKALLSTAPITPGSFAVIAMTKPPCALRLLGTAKSREDALALARFSGVSRPTAIFITIDEAADRPKQNFFLVTP